MPTPASYWQPQVIYGLACPDCRAIRYVGHTHKSVAERANDHRHNGHNPRVVEWLRDLHEAGKSPLCLELGHSEGGMPAYGYEETWIRTAAVIYGANLLNEFFNCTFVSTYEVELSARCHKSFVNRERRHAEWVARAEERKREYAAYCAKRLKRRLIQKHAERLGLTPAAIKYRIGTAMRRGKSLATALELS